MLEAVRNYYDEKVSEFGPTPGGVDWNGTESQSVRFDVLSQLVRGSNEQPISVDDYGCGYGAYLDYLRTHGMTNIDYIGLDVAPKMIEEARKRHPSRGFLVGDSSPRIADYAVASGIFNVALDTNREEWLSHILATLDKMDAATTAGFAFNCLTSYSHADKKRPYLYYGDPCFYFNHCKSSYSDHVALLHDYGLYEFTILVRKNK